MKAGAFAGFFYKDLDLIKSNISKLHRTDRQSVLSDVVAFAKAGLIGFTKIIEILSALENETDLCVCTVMIGAFNLLTNYFPSSRSALIPFGLKIFRPILDKIGFEAKLNEIGGNSKLRVSLLSLLGIFCGEKELTSYGVKLFGEFQKVDKVPEGVDPSLLGFILQCGSLFTGDGLDYVAGLAKNSPYPDVKCRACIAIGFVQEDKIEKSLSLLTSVRTQDYAYVFAGLVGSPNANLKIWEYFKQNYDNLMKLFGELSFGMSYFIEDCASLFNTEEGAQEFAKFFETHECKSAELSIKQSIEAIQIRAKANKSDSESIRNFFK